MIGVFDSGVGGLSVWKELVALMPGQRYMYVSDSGFCPYGPRSKSYVIERCKRISEFLICNGADLIVVACNTATAASIEVLRSTYEIPFVGMEPAVKPAALQSESGVIGVLATQGTLKGELYLRTLHKFAANTSVIEQVGNGLVELVERGETYTPQAFELLESYIKPMLQAGADHIVLGCTHYPFLSAAIEKIAGSGVKIVNPAPAIARQAKSLLSMGGKSINLSVGKNMFYTTGKNLPLLEKMVTDVVEELFKEGKLRSDLYVRDKRFCSIDI